MQSRRVVHVVPADLSRGAQVHARALQHELNRVGEHHTTVTLFRAEESALGVDDSLGVQSGKLRRVGYDPRAAWRLRRYLRHVAPDAVVAHGGEALKYAAFVVPRRRLLYLKIGTSMGVLAGRAHRQLYRVLMRRASVIAAISQDAADEAVSLFGIPRARIFIVPNGRDPAAFPPWVPHEGPPVLLFVGRLTATKRPTRFIEIANALRTKVAFQALMVGDGPLRVELGRLANGGQVTLVGPRDDVPDILAAADVFLFTSRNEGEGMPGVLIEAGLAGLPTVATQVPGASSVVDHEQTGFLVPIDDFDAMVNATERLLVDESLRRRMGAAARAKCLSTLTIEASARALARALDGLD